MDFSEVGIREKEEAGPLVVIGYMDMDKIKEDFGIYRGAIEEMDQRANDHRVEDGKSLEVAVSMAGKAKELNKKIETKRKEVVEEPNKFVKSVNGFVKSFSVKLDEIERNLKKKIGDYQYRVELKRREEEKRAREEAERLQAEIDKEAEEKGVETVQVVTPVVPKKDTVARAESGASAYIKEVWKAEVIDPEKVPREFCSPDMKKINEAVRLGLRKIGGVSIFKDISTVLRV